MRSNFSPTSTLTPIKKCCASAETQSRQFIHLTQPSFVVQAFSSSSLTRNKATWGDKKKRRRASLRKLRKLVHSNGRNGTLWLIDGGPSGCRNLRFDTLLLLMVIPLWLLMMTSFFEGSILRMTLMVQTNLSHFPQRRSDVKLLFALPSVLKQNSCEKSAIKRFSINFFELHKL